MMWWQKHCNFCYCLLDNRINTHRSFSLRSATSDTHNQKVVTGVRIVKDEGTFYLQIQQGKLLALGQIDHSTVEWKDIDKPQGYPIEGFDIFTMDYDNKNIQLDTVESASPNVTVTGVMFRQINNGIRLEVRYHTFDFSTGQLQSVNGYWTYSDNSRKLLPLNEPLVSTKTPQKSKPTPFYDSVEFTPSSKSADAAQTTLPFFDIQKVQSQSPFPLAGVGLYHKGYSNYGGFIAPKILTLDYSKFLDNGV